MGYDEELSTIFINAISMVHFHSVFLANLRSAKRKGNGESVCPAILIRFWHRYPDVLFLGGMEKVTRDVQGAMQDHEE